MAMVVACPCGRQLQLDEKFAGTAVRCPICQQTFLAPARRDDDFVLENRAPAKNAIAPARSSRPSAASTPANREEPETFKLADAEDDEKPAAGSSPSRSARKPRPQSEPERPRRRRARQSDSLLLKIGSLFATFTDSIGVRARTALDILAVAALIAGPVMMIVASRNLLRDDGASATPQTITLAQLMEKGTGPNNHVILTNFEPIEPFLYEYRQGRYDRMLGTKPEDAQWVKAWVPLVPTGTGPNPSRIPVLVQLKRGHSKTYVEDWLQNKRTVQGLVVDRLDLNSEIGRKLSQELPRTDLSHCVILHEGETPTNPVHWILSILLAVPLMFMGGLWLIFRVLFRDP